MSLHQRPAFSNGAHNGTANGAPKQGTKLNGIHAPTPIKPRREFSSRFKALFALISLGVLWAAIRSSSHASDTYALCSQDGDDVYTVDANNAKTQCVVIRKAYILDTGSLCTFSPGDHPKNFTNPEHKCLDSGYQWSLEVFSLSESS